MPSNIPSAPPEYSDSVVRGFALMAVVWGIVGMLVGWSSPRNWPGPS